MAVREPLYFLNGNLTAMSSGEVAQWRQKMQFVYSQSPTAVLTQVANSGANIAAMSDTRTQAGATGQDATNFDLVAETADVATVTVAFDKINLAYTASGSVGQVTDTGISFPVYYDTDTGAVRAMTLTDMLDTFVFPTILTMTTAAESAATAGTHTITNSATAASGYTVVSTTAVFIDTRANAGAFTAAGIPETLDQPTTITSYFLHVRDGVDNTPSRSPLYINASNNLQEYSIDDAATLFGNLLRFEAAHSSGGYKISYNVGTSGDGNVRGTAMVNTKLDGSTYRTLQVSDDYRAQEQPSGTAQAISSYNLRIHVS